MTKKSDINIVSTQVTSGDLFISSESVETTIDRVVVSGSYTYIALKIAPEVLVRIADEEVAKALCNSEGSSLTIAKAFKTIDEEPDAVAGVGNTYNLTITVKPSTPKPKARKSAVSSSPAKRITSFNEF